MDDYQKSYYEKNKEKIKERQRQRRLQEKIQSSPLSLVPDRVQSVQASTPPTVPVSKSKPREGVQAVRSSFNPLSHAALFFLGCMVTALLLHQMLQYYSDDPTLLKWLKALSMEGLVLFFATLNHSKLAYRMLYRVLAFLMCVLSIYTMSAKELDAHTLNAQKHQTSFKSVQEIESLIQDKKNIQAQYIEREWITAAKTNLNSLEQLNQKLNSSRLSWLETASQYHRLIVQLLTRVFFMLGNILIAQHLMSGLRQRYG